MQRINTDLVRSFSSFFCSFQTINTNIYSIFSSLAVVKVAEAVNCVWSKLSSILKSIEWVTVCRDNFPAPDAHPNDNVNEVLVAADMALDHNSISPFADCCCWCCRCRCWLFEALLLDSRVVHMTMVIECANAFDTHRSHKNRWFRLAKVAAAW